MKTNFWRKYNMALIPRLAPHVLVDTKNIISIIKSNKVLFARWITDFDCDNITGFWYVIKDNAIDLSDYSSNTRNKIRKGLKMCIVRKITLEEFFSYGYEVYYQAFQNYITFNKIIPKDVFQKNILQLDDNYDVWGVFNLQGKLIGYSQNSLKNNVCEFCVTKFHPDYLKLRPSEALFYTMCNYYLDEQAVKYIHNGTRSIAHHTNIQDFLIKKFKFRKAYCNLHVEYHPIIKLIVCLLFPIRKVFDFIPFGFFVNVNIVLFQEKIRRDCLKKKRC